jgi:3-hydroxyisobutyrate dehydrogenase
MGGGMACRLAESGYQVAVYNRTRDKTADAAELGATVAETPAQAAADADVVMLSLANQDVVNQLLYGDDGVIGSLREGGYIVDMSTVPPSFSRETAERSATTGHHSLDACVYGAPFHARSGDLRVMVGGNEADFEALRPVFETIGKQVTRMGESGMGATMKLVLNMLMGVQMPAMAEAIAFGERAGLDRAQILEAIPGTGYASPVMSFRCPMIADRAFENPLFRLKLMRKDMKLVLQQCLDLGIPMPVTEASYSMLMAAENEGLGELDVAAIMAFQERMSGMTSTDYPFPEPGATT